MTDIGVLILSISTSIATIIYSLKNIKKLECCCGLSKCSQVQNQNPNTPRDNNNEIVELQTQIQNLSSIINDII